jgi:hypothetical protein
VSVGDQGRGVVMAGGLGAGAREQRRKAEYGQEMDARQSSGTYGRKLQAEAGRFATRVNISEISFCW